MQGNWKYVVIICVVVLGGLFELMKSADFADNQANLTPAELKALDFQPYARKSGDSQVNEGQKTIKRLEEIRTRALQARQQNTDHQFPQEHSFNQIPPAPPAPKKPGKVSTVKNKKKKKTAKNPHKKKTDEEKPPVAKKDDKKKDEEKPEETTEDTDFFAGGGNSTPDPVIPPVGVGADPNKEEVPNADEWVRRVLARPSLEETTEMIKYYQSNLITAEVFYYVVEQMFADSQERMRELGIMAGNATPSYRSFTILAQFLQDEPFGSSLRTKANQALDRYTQLAYLNVLESVMRSQESPGIREKALSLLVDSARKNLAAAANNPPPPGPTGQSTGSPLVKRYSDILNTLEQMLGSGTEPAQVSTALQNAVDGLKGILSA
ncbi:MAG: hypothetical protein H6624_10995 [Bdellovibrionaceae bacterium]|nr:hypothetical protein [Bdellovibrionales bacterium]MCB9084864.1 hypothetical protein [Pseudobdellovibrionaceae bacterium]